MAPHFGAFVISLDFELHWGVRDHLSTSGRYAANLLGVREAVPAMLALFSEFDAAATWATVGFLFAHDRDELERFSPRIKPTYRRRVLSPFQEVVGEDEHDDPFHYAPSLITAILNTARQEIATHTFSHYYCLEAGQSQAAFQADLCSAIEIARTWGVELHSIVFPRNQRNPAHDEVLIQAGIKSFRGNQPSWLYQPGGGMPTLFLRKLGRAVDTYLPVSGHQCVPWSSIKEASGLANVRASHYMRSYSPRWRALEPLRLRRHQRALVRAARRHEIFHLWWHPHNFGTHLEQNLAALRTLLDVFAQCREHYGMRSLSMCEVAQIVSS